MRRALCVLILLFPFSAFAQIGVELTPFGGYRWGGTIAQETTDLFGRDVEIADRPSYGVMLDIPISRGLQMELMADRQESWFRTNGGLFEPSQRIADVDLTYYHAGFLWEFDRRDVSPFFVLSAGLADINPHIEGVENESRLSGSLGGGVKIFLNRNFGLRLEGRGYWTDLNKQNTDCYRCGYQYDRDLYQGEVRVGAMIVF